MHSFLYKNKKTVNFRLKLADSYFFYDSHTQLFFFIYAVHSSKGVGRKFFEGGNKRNTKTEK